MLWLWPLTQTVFFLLSQKTPEFKSLPSATLVSLHASLGSEKNVLLKLWCKGELSELTEVLPSC